MKWVLFCCRVCCTSCSVGWVVWGGLGYWCWWVALLRVVLLGLFVYLFGLCLCICCGLRGGLVCDWSCCGVSVSAGVYVLW